MRTHLQAGDELALVLRVGGGVDPVLQRRGSDVHAPRREVERGQRLVVVELRGPHRGDEHRVGGPADAVRQNLRQLVVAVRDVRP